MEKIKVPDNRLDDKYDWVHFNAEEVKAILNGIRLRKKALVKELLSGSKEHWKLDAKRKITIIESIENKLEDARVTTHTRV